MIFVFARLHFESISFAHSSTETENDEQFTGTLTDESQETNPSMQDDPTIEQSTDIVMDETAQVGWVPTPAVSIWSVHCWSFQKSTRWISRRWQTQDPSFR